MRSPLLKILVCYHRISPIIANEILQPILVGAKNATKGEGDHPSGRYILLCG